ncbi:MULTISPECIES: hypothetical protein [unclassified Streptomyces]|uniref:hypothetical protein n=1 Tax=unclassified Streptomyces TaxID=2593676 RepID=UPI001319E7E7|nr:MULTISPECIES: hypothetical protein [unclassified Streptomyces]MYT33703.1 hypothetical protein [Streptomyces sp. SID8354]
MTPSNSKGANDNELDPATNLGIALMRGADIDLEQQWRACARDCPRPPSMRRARRCS